jgi:hypothetical protein
VLLWSMVMHACELDGLARGHITNQEKVWLGGIVESSLSIFSIRFYFLVVFFF